MWIVKLSLRFNIHLQDKRPVVTAPSRLAHRNTASICRDDEDNLYLSNDFHVGYGTLHHLY